MGEYDKNFTFRMPPELREAIELVSQIEDRSLSKLAEYLMWAGLQNYCASKGLLTPYEVNELSQNYKQRLEEAGLMGILPASASNGTQPNFLMSEGTGKPSKKRLSSAIRKDLADVQRDFQERKKKRGK